MTFVKKNSPTVSVENPSVSRDYYIKQFNAKVTFDCGWYINITLGNCELCFMQPQSPEQAKFDGKGLMYSFEIENVDEEHDRLSKLGVTIVMPLEDHPWGDRGFGMLDPNGIVLYFYKPTKPADEFKKYYKNT